jgi:hypothetical protein
MTFSLPSLKHSAGIVMFALRAVPRRSWEGCYDRNA